eukprot:SM000049S16733  [mRNA]  locus=s49:386885:387264:+ [translate_table: standard]
MRLTTFEGACIYCHALSKRNGDFSLLMACQRRLLNGRLERLCRMQHLDPEHPGHKEDCLGVLIALIGGDGKATFINIFNHMIPAYALAADITNIYQN